MNVNRKDILNHVNRNILNLGLKFLENVSVELIEFSICVADFLKIC